MPSPALSVQEHHLLMLKNIITDRYGKSISSKADCDHLSELIECQTGKTISVNTLRRFFDVMPAHGKSSLVTLNILASFCGYTDMHEFCQMANREKESILPNLTLDGVNDLYMALGDTDRFYTTFSWLLKYAFKDNNIDFLKDLFELNVLRERYDYTQGDFKKALMTLGLEMQANPAVFNTLIKHYAGNPVAQALYFECFVDYDFLTIRHHHAIRAYAENKNSSEAQLFSLCMLFLYAFLSNDRLTCKELLSRINRIEFSRDLHPFPSGRKMACNILYQAFYLDGVKASLIREVFELESKMPRLGALGRNSPFYHVMVAEAFAWSGLHHEAIAILELALRSYKIESNYHTQDVLSNLWLTYSDALLKSSRMDESREAYSKVNAHHFDVHIKNFSLMHYYKTGSEIQKQNNPRLAASLKKTSLEIAAHHKFKFFYTLYS